MSDDIPRAAGRAAELRESFDRAFAVPPPGKGEESEDMLGIRAGDGLYLLRVREMAGLAACRRIVPLPSRTPDLLGLAGIRGEIVPVYGLAGFLGYGRPGEGPRWLALCGAKGLVALAFDGLDGHFRVLRSAVSVPGRDSAREHVKELARVGASVREVVSIPSVLKAIAGLAGPAGRDKER